MESVFPWPQIKKLLLRIWNMRQSFMKEQIVLEFSNRGVLKGFSDTLTQGSKGQ